MSTCRVKSQQKNDLASCSLWSMAANSWSNDTLQELLHAPSATTVMPCRHSYFHIFTTILDLQPFHRSL
jgi:hypothetical protein